MAKIEADRVKAARETPTIAGRLNKDRSSIGSSWRHSAMMKTAIRSPDPTRSPTM